MRYQHADALLAAIVASSDDAIISKDLNGVILTWNEGAERMFGYSAEEAIGQPVSIIVPSEKEAEEKEVLDRVRSGEGIHHYDTLRRHRDGRIIEISMAVSPLRDESGTLVGASNVARDVTESRRAQREAFRLAAIVEFSEDAIASKDTNGIVQTWNKAAERMFGFTADEMIGQSITKIIPQDRLSEEDEVLRRIRAGLSIIHFETVRQKKNGELLDISLTVSPIKRTDGTVIGASKIARDITDQKRLRRMAEEASRLKDEFLAVLSHELRTPLNTVLGYARMLRRQDAKMNEEFRQRALDALERNAETLTRLVNDVLDTSRIVTGKLRLALEPCPIQDVIREAIDTVYPTAHAKGVELQAIYEQTAIVLGDRDRLQQVVWNLLSNAVKFTPAGGSVTVYVRRDGPEVSVAVRDTGIGISSEHLPYVFQRFWQAHTGASREFSGLGIGLALARHIVELHGGSISADSDGTGRGATFTITLPAASAMLARERVLRPVAK
jgi:PAS domain S-box-containing protein